MICILLILTVSLSSDIQAQEMIPVERWRLEMVIKELMQKDLMDSTLAAQKVVIQELEKTDSIRLRQIESLIHRITEKEIQVNVLSEFNQSYMNEILDTRKERDKYKKQRNAVLIIGGMVITAQGLLIGILALK